MQPGCTVLHPKMKATTIEECRRGSRKGSCGHYPRKRLAQEQRLSGALELTGQRVPSEENTTTYPDDPTRHFRLSSAAALPKIKLSNQMIDVHKRRYARSPESAVSVSAASLLSSFPPGAVVMTLSVRSLESSAFFASSTTVTSVRKRAKTEANNIKGRIAIKRWKRTRFMVRPLQFRT